MQKKKIKDIDQEAFSSKIHSESDRTSAILGASLLDAKLENIFNTRLKKFQNELLNETGPLSTFSARIKLANALGWIDNPVQSDLDVIRRIRNDFAHSFDHELSFQGQSIHNLCNNLLIAQSYLDGYEDSIGAPGQILSKYAIRSIKKTFESPRWRFLLTVDFISQYLDEIVDRNLEYQGTNLLKEVRELSAKPSMKFSATGSVGPSK